MVNNKEDDTIEKILEDMLGEDLEKFIEGYGSEASNILYKLYKNTKENIVDWELIVDSVNMEYVYITDLYTVINSDSDDIYRELSNYEIILNDTNILFSNIDGSYSYIEEGFGIVELLNNAILESKGIKNDKIKE